MSKNKSSFTAGVFLAAGAFVGAWLVSKFYEKKLVNGDIIVGNVRRLFTVVGTIEGSWIEMEPVYIEQEDFSGYVYYGGITRKEQEELVQYEFFADAKTGAVLDLYKIASA
ncbi:MAG: PepSY domain-containing protein [Granulicatella sp.]|uniref:PepSY domain-containing protein n=1 Tax=uncultured Granulicatella sp. TaxID=316089 RepID=UPI0028D32001|nr:PepSY domain-containing protein [uncultured Granulicatella sp.]